MELNDRPGGLRGNAIDARQFSPALNARAVVGILRFRNRGLVARIAAGAGRVVTDLISVGVAPMDAHQRGPPRRLDALHAAQNPEAVPFTPLHRKSSLPVAIESFALVGADQKVAVGLSDELRLDFVPGGDAPPLVGSGLAGRQLAGEKGDDGGAERKTFHGGPSNQSAVATGRQGPAASGATVSKGFAFLRPRGCVVG
jgi:hypothetical protein